MEIDVPVMPTVREEDPGETEPENREVVGAQTQTGSEACQNTQLR